ncbi:hypothetical protein BIW11_02634 [Tropilaelaps mercedesae]|uniref:Uncharacterized protein n=1 Tax=Tropilaelaps mercedesae TaxID=418985 RepID=A0A1V9XZR0_9ACAR|nr:hypothetical protein BIW11_02634 [Tropilaelaps mercedesae]
MCDSEHMFDCPGATKEDEVNTLARQISNEGLMKSALDRIAHHLDGDGNRNSLAESNTVPVEGQHKSLVAKKFFNKETHADYTKSLSERNRKNENEQSKSKRNQKRVRRVAKDSHSVRKVNVTKDAVISSQESNFKTRKEINPYLQGEKLPVVAKKG